MGTRSDDHMKNAISTNILEFVDDSGHALLFERYERSFPLVRFDHDPAYKQHCESCGSYGKNLACPPYSPNFADHVAGAGLATVILMRVPMEYFNQIIIEERYRTGFRLARKVLTDELIQRRTQGLTIAGSGKCLFCEQCAIERGYERCIEPSMRIYSLESLGVNVVKLVSQCFGLELEWSAKQRVADFVSAVGAVFHSI